MKEGQRQAVREHQGQRWPAGALGVRLGGSMIFYRTRQSWLPRKLFSLEPGNWFFAYAMTNN